MPNTTVASLTLAQIETLRTEAATAGDSAMVEICDRALSGSPRAIVAVVNAIRNAEANL